MRFIFRLDLNLHAGAGKKFGILNLGTKHGAPKEQSQLQVTNGNAMAAYQQFMGRLPQGPQM